MTVRSRTDYTVSVPIYEYECRKCGHRFEVIQKVSDAPLKKCEKCKGRADRLISSPAIQFKGTGWYVTDYARKGQGTDKDKDKDKGSESDKSSSSSEKKTSDKKKAKTGTSSSSK